jgi:hypothetical protein
VLSSLAFGRIVRIYRMFRLRLSVVLLSLSHFPKLVFGDQLNCSFSVKGKAIPVTGSGGP